MRAEPIRIVIVDDHRILLDALAARIGREPDLQVDCAASDAETALAAVTKLQPDILVLDIDLPGTGPFDLLAQASAAAPAMKTLFLSGYLSDALVERAVRLNAGGYVLKGEPVSFLLDAIRSVASGERCFSREVEERLILDPNTKRYNLRTESRLASLTNRQLEVLRLLAKGQSVKQVAQTMHLSEKSVDSHKYRLMNKLDIHDRVELARFAIREGLTTP